VKTKGSVCPGAQPDPPHVRATISACGGLEPPATLHRLLQVSPGDRRRRRRTALLSQWVGWAAVVSSQRPAGSPDLTPPKHTRARALLHAASGLSSGKLDSSSCSGCQRPWRLCPDGRDAPAASCCGHVTRCGNQPPDLHWGGRGCSSIPGRHGTQMPLVGSGTVCCCR
jgi:hypothetical protein